MSVHRHDVDMVVSSTCSLYDDYHQNGFVGPIDVISVNEATDIMNKFCNDSNIFPSDRIRPDDRRQQPSHFQQQARQQQKQQQQQQQLGGKNRSIYNQKNDNLFKTYLFVPYINQLVRNPKLVRAVQTVLQTNDIRCWSCDFNIRDCGTLDMIAPHQDSTYAGLSPCEEVVTAWIALSDPVSIQEGGLIFYSGSHSLGQLPHACDVILRDDDDDDDHYIDIDSTNKKKNLLKEENELEKNGCHETQHGRRTKLELRNVLSLGQHCDIPNGREKEGTSIPLRAGQATLHHSYTIHSSGPNLSMNGQPRIGLAIRYISANVRKHNCKVKEMITYISGRTDIMHDDCFDYWEPILPDHPTQLDIDRGKAIHAIAMERETTNYFLQQHGT